MGKRFHLRKAANSLVSVIILVIFGSILISIPPTIKSHASSVIWVNSSDDVAKNDNKCTLREAVISANRDERSGRKPNECAAGDGADVIYLPNDLGVYSLSRTDNGNEDSSQTGDLDITSDVTIEAVGEGVIVSGDSSFTDRIFHILSGEVAINQISISGGNVRGDGGGIMNTGFLSLRNTTIHNNAAEGSGGGLANQGSLRLNNVTVINNSADTNMDNIGDGGGIARLNGAIEISNSIVAANSDLSSLTIAPDCSGTVNSLDFNLFQDLSECSLSGPTDNTITGINPGLEPLENDTGLIYAYSPEDGSVTIDAGNPATPGSATSACEPVDQRGAFRPHGQTCDLGSIEAGNTNTTLLIRAFADSSTTTVVGTFSGAPNLTYIVQLFSAPDRETDCLISGACTEIGEPFPVTIGAEGDLIFSETLDFTIPHGEFIRATVSDPAGFPSDFSDPVRVGSGNDSWPRALLLELEGTPQSLAETDGYIELEGQSRWFKFEVKPGSQVVLTLTDLPENYDLTLYKDISQAYSSLETQDDLLRLGAEFAPDVFTPDAFTSDVFSPDVFTPDVFTPDVFTPDVFTPDVFTPDAFTPDVFTPDVFTPDAFIPDAFSPDVFTPDVFTPDVFTPDVFTPDVFTPDEFSSAQTRSLIGISAFSGVVSEGIRINTWDSTGEYYVRVRGRNGVFNPALPFHLEVNQTEGPCSTISDDGFPASSLTPVPGDHKTLILTHAGLIEGGAADIAAMDLQLANFAARPEVDGVIIDVSQDARVAVARAQADQNPACPQAQNLLAESIKGLVDAYWSANPNLEYIVILGSDSAIPFFRHPDHSMLASEKNYAPPVLDGSSSQASLKLGYVLSQDDYGSRVRVSLKDDGLPLPELGVGRLVETAADINNMLSAYLSTPNGVVPTPQTTLVTGYDFLEDAALGVQSEFQAGLGSGGMAEQLISPRDLAPTDPASWNADDLRSALLGGRHDLVFLAGHFSASSALAADYETRLLAEELRDSTIDLTNSIIFSAGCHSGYNIVNPHGVPGLTREPDWAQAAAHKGITLIAGTGYQYGDTDLIKYSEQLYLEFSRQLRTGTGEVSVGNALVRAKQIYLATNPYLRGIDEKSVLEATLFGFPMLSVNMPGDRLAEGNDPSVATNLQSFSQNPGAALGMIYADITINPQTTLNAVELTNIADTSTPTTAEYLAGPDGVVTKPNEPTLPLGLYNATHPDTILRGVGFRGGQYTDLLDVIPLTGAAATEIRGVHTPFISRIFFPSKLWQINHFDALADISGGITQLAVLPGQYKSSSSGSISGTLRKYDQFDFRLYYSDNVATYTNSDGDESIPALSAPPSIVNVTSTSSSAEVQFQVQVVGNPAAGIQEVWITYTTENGSMSGAWTSMDLLQNPGNSTLWERVLPLNGNLPEDIRFIVQAVNGVGLVSLDTNFGEYYIPGENNTALQPTNLELIPTPPQSTIPSSGRYSTDATFSARLTADGTPLAGKAVAFLVGSQGRLAITDGQGIATVLIALFGQAGENGLRASFAGDGGFQADSASQPLTILRQSTQISLDPALPSAFAEDEIILTATLTDTDGARLGEETLIFLISGSGGTYAEAVITDYAGRAWLGELPLPPGDYTLEVFFADSISELGVDLTDERYEPTHLIASLELLNHGPIAEGDSYSVNEDTTLEVSQETGVLSNDTDEDNDALQAMIASDPVSGTLSLNLDGSFTYAPATNFAGSDAFSYSASDGQNTTDPVEVVITILPVNDAPQAITDTFVLDENSTLSVAAPGVLANDLDVEGTPLDANLIEGPLHGSVSLNRDGGFIYTPMPGFSGSDLFTYTADDGELSSNAAEVLLTILEVNDPPDCSGAQPSRSSLWPPNGNFRLVTILGLQDPEGDPLTWEITAVFQDEPVGSQPDAIIEGETVRLRSERDGNSDGRVYHIFFEVFDDQGGTCTGEVLSGVVPHDQGSDLPPVDGGPLYDSTLAN